MKTIQLNNEQILFLNKFLITIPDNIKLSLIGTAFIPIGMNRFIRSRLRDSNYNTLDGGYHQVSFKEIRDYWIKHHMKK